MRSIRLNTYWDSIERARVQREPQPAFQSHDRTPWDGPETHSSEPTRYPGIFACGCPRLVVQLGTPVFGGRANGADVPKVERSEAMRAQAKRSRGPERAIKLAAPASPTCEERPLASWSNHFSGVLVDPAQAGVFQTPGRAWVQWGSHDESAPVYAEVQLARVEIQWRAIAAARRWGSKTVLLLSI
jgi:hypothetical protein